MNSPQPLFRVEHVRTIDKLAITHCGVSGYELMGRAGGAALDLLRKVWPACKTIGIACGPGNNGGDGYVLAPLLKQHGMDVKIIIVPGGTPHTEDAGRAYDEWRALGERVEVFDEPLPRVDLWVDAIYGIGLSRPPHGAAQSLIERINASGMPILALDVPSGLDADAGHAIGACILATHTLSFVSGKRGLYTGDAREHCGTLHHHGLALPASVQTRFTPAAFLLRAENLASALAPRHANAHKGEYGHVLCVGGEVGMGGAVRLCAEAALRVGAGLASVATRTEGVSALVAARPEAMTHAVENAQDLLPLIANADVIAVGPGLGQNDWGKALFDCAIASKKTLILDADALNLLAQNPQQIPQAILTPHPGEAARLLGITTQQVQSNRYDAIDALVKKYQCVVVLKGAGTLVAAPNEITHVIDAGNPGMSTGGMGDLLTGVIAGLQAQKFSLFDAACFGALLHGMAGDAAAGVGGERGLLPSDLFPHLRRLVNGI
jgi:ADP-dependent NAD(P)H-hydrate dehydratase / NAD(P)H-hydrate epimerase